MATNFSTRYKKDLSTETLKTKLAHRKSLLQKESRHKEFNRGRQFGLIDVNTQASRENNFSRLKEMKENHSPKGRAKPEVPAVVSTASNGRITRAAAAAVSAKTKIPQISRPTTTTDETSKTIAKMQQRIEMLQRYKAEKELRKLKEQREKPVFKCGRFKPEAPGFLSKASQIPVLSKPKETIVKTATVEALPVRVTRSKTKNFSEVPAVVSTASNGRITRAAAAAVGAKTKIPQSSRPTTTTGKSAQKKETNKGKQQRAVKKEEAVMEEIAVMDSVKEEASPQIVEETVQDEASLEKENLPASHIPVSVPPKRARSFAPQNFVFKPLEGLTNYKVKPMSPSKADGFLSPNLSWSPMTNISEVPKKDTKETGSNVCGLNQKFFATPEVTENNTQEHQLTPEFPSIEAEPVPEDLMEISPSLQLTDLCADPIAEPTKEAQHDVSYFRNILQSETERLSTQCLEWDGTAETDIPEDAKDLVRTTIGQTRLLIAERFKQFEGLVDNCEFQRGEKETTCTDLDGFWDMVNFQVEDVNKKFENLRRLQGNGWQMVEDVQAKKACKKKAAPQRATKAGDGAKERAAARKRLATIKALMKSKMEQEDAPVSQEEPAEGEKVVFDGGFFQVESPAKALSGWTPKSAGRTPRPRRTTPRSAMKGVLQNCAETCVLSRDTPTTTKAITPLPDLDACVGPCGASLLGSISEQSDIQDTEKPCVTTENVLEEEATNTPLAICDKESSGDQNNVLVSVNVDETVQESNVRKEVSEATEEMEQSDESVSERYIFCNSKRESQTESQPLQEAKQKDSDSLLLDDLSCEIPCGNGMPDWQPELEDSLFFTPLRNKTEQLTAVAACNDLMSFSPLTVPEEGK
ncbi:disks large-associated protein 5 isoform X2 [Anolis sagrei]|uniref:disks large-associated protein 5 isoform X2 n=1 Tax=Anolis sagrei TaxID=38937 RepID=UPI003520BB27